jgi:hypothetical protein
MARSPEGAAIATLHPRTSNEHKPSRAGRAHESPLACGCWSYCHDRSRGLPRVFERSKLSRVRFARLLLVSRPRLLEQLHGSLRGTPRLPEGLGMRPKRRMRPDGGYPESCRLLQRTVGLRLACDVRRRQLLPCRRLRQWCRLHGWLHVHACRGGSSMSGPTARREPAGCRKPGRFRPRSRPWRRAGIGPGRWRDVHRRLLPVMGQPRRPCGPSRNRHLP